MTGETTIIEVRPERGGFAYFEVATANGINNGIKFKVCLKGSANRFGNYYKDYHAAFRAALRRAQAFDDGGVSLSQRRILMKRYAQHLQ